MNDNNEWTLVTASNKKRVMRKRGTRRRTPPQQNKPEQPALDTVESIDECITECTRYLCRPSENGIWQKTVGLLNDLFPHVDEMVCFGIGNFAKTRPSCFNAPLWQVSFALALQTELKCTKVSFYDPVALPIENEYLKNQPDCTVLETNQKGHYRATDRALYFLPHCPRRLYENILRENWGQEDLCLIGNSLERLVESCNFMPCTKLLLPFCTTIVLCCTKEELRWAPGNLVGAFNDTYLCMINSVPWAELECPIIANDDGEVDCELL
jgi:SRR1